MSGEGSVLQVHKVLDDKTPAVALSLDGEVVCFMDHTYAHAIGLALIELAEWAKANEPSALVNAPSTKKLQ